VFALETRMLPTIKSFEAYTTKKQNNKNDKQIKQKKKKNDREYKTDT